MAQKNTPDSTLLIDIGTASVGGAFVSIGKNKSPLLSKVTRVPIGSGTLSSRDALVSHAEEALKTLMEKYAKDSPKFVRVVVSSPWHEAHIRTIISTSEKRAYVTEKTVLNTVLKYQNEKPPHEGNSDVEAVATQIKVNGYPTALARGVLGTSISINLYESEIKSAIERTLANPIEKAFPNASLTFNTFPLVATVALRTISNETGFIVADVTGEMTEIAILHDDSIRHLASFPIGFYSIARDSAKNKKSEGIGDTLSRLALLARNELSEEEAARIQQSFEKAFIEWKNAFEEVIQSASEHTPIPRTMYILSDKEPLVWIKRGIEAGNTYALEVIPVNAPLIQTFVEVGESGYYDIFLSLSALFFHTGKANVLGEKSGLSMVYSQ